MRWKLLLLSFLLPFFASSQQIQKHINYKGNHIGFLEYKPSNYKRYGSEKHPLIIFLHGIGESGNGTTELKNVQRIAIPRYIKEGNPMRFYKNGKWHNFVVLSPQCSKKHGMWPPFYVDAMIEYAEKNLNIDPNRIYLTGLSLGGGGTLKYISTSAANAKKIAAIATVCAPSSPLKNACNVAEAKLPVWSFHASNDNIVRISDMHRNINRINACRPAVKPKATVWPTGGHQIWDKAYDTKHRYQTPNVFEWFLGYTRNRSTEEKDELSTPVQKPSPGGKNIRPVAKAGSTQRHQFPAGSVVLNGTGSYDNNDYIKSYQWEQAHGPAGARIANPRSAKTNVYNLKPGYYIFRLKVIDSRGSAGVDVVRIYVNAAPIVQAGIDRTIHLPNHSLEVNGNGTYDKDGWISSYRWTKISGPSKFRIHSPSKLRTRISGLAEGVYVFRFTATDGHGAKSHDDMRVYVRRGRAHYSNNAVVDSTETLSASRAIGDTIAAAVRENNVEPEAVMTIAPNPAVSFINLSLKNSVTGKAMVMIYDISGRQAMSLVINKDGLLLNKTIDVAGLEKGMYVLRVTVNGKIAASKQFMKQ